MIEEDLVPAIMRSIHALDLKLDDTMLEKRANFIERVEWIKKNGIISRMVELPKLLCMGRVKCVYSDFCISLLCSVPIVNGGQLLKRDGSGNFSGFGAIVLS